MMRRLIAGVALVLLALGPAAAEIGDYKNIGPRQVVGRIVRDLAGDDVEVRRAASDELKALSEKSLGRLGIEPEAEETLLLIGDGIAELYWMGKATSRTRAERSMDEVVTALGLAARSSDKPKANSAHKLMVRYVSVLMRNADHPSSVATIAELKKHLKAWPEEEITPANSVVSFLTEAPEEKKPETPPAPEPTALAEAEPAETPPEAPPPVPVQATKAPEPEPVTVVAPEKSRPAEPKPAPEAEPAAPAAKPRVVDSAAWKYADPALKVTTVIAPTQSRMGAKTVGEAETPAPRAPQTPVAEAPGDGTSILNILQMQLASEDERRLEAGLKLTAKTSDEVLNHLNHGNDERSKAIVKRVRSLVDHKSLAVRRQAMRTSATLRDNLAAPQIASNLGGQDEETSRTAYEALKAISGIDLGPTREPWAKWAAEQR